MLFQQFLTRMLRKITPRSSSTRRLAVWGFVFPLFFQYVLVVVENGAGGEAEEKCLGYIQIEAMSVFTAFIFRLARVYHLCGDSFVGKQTAEIVEILIEVRVYV